MFQPTRVCPLFANELGFPGRLTTEPISIFIVDGTDPVVPVVFALKVNVPRHTA